MFGLESGAPAPGQPFICSFDGPAHFAAVDEKVNRSHFKHEASLRGISKTNGQISITSTEDIEGPQIIND